MDDNDEDEDVIFEGSELYAHLVNSDYSGPDIDYCSSKNAPPVKKSTVQESTSRWQKLWPELRSKFLGFSDHNHEEEFARLVIQHILDSPLVSLEDFDFLSNMFEDLLSKSAFTNSPAGDNFGITAIGGAALSVALISSPELPWTLQAPSLFFIGWNVLRALNQRLGHLKRTKYQLLAAQFQSSLGKLHGLCSIMTKSLQFIQEMELIDRGFTLPNLVTHLSMKTLPSQPSALLCLPLREELMGTARQLHHLARDSTLRIRDCLPLGTAVDNPSHYLACISPAAGDAQHEEDTATTVALPTLRACMRQCHLQISEMLRRLALCFLLPVSPNHHVRLMVEMSRDLPRWSGELGARLQTAYDYFAAWKVSDEPTCRSALSPSSGLNLALHSLERHLRATALIIESARDSNWEPMQSLRVQLSHECQAVSTCWELVELELEKLAGPKATEPEEPAAGPSVRPVLPAGRDQEAQPLYGAWEPDVEDLEILEADLANEPARMSHYDDDDDLLLRETREERLARKKELAAQSKRLYSELQVVLQSKAAEWREREAKVMQRLGRPMEPEEEADPPPDIPVEQPPPPPAPPAKFESIPSSTFSLQASLAAQVRAMASQRTVQHEDVIGDDDDEDSSSEDYRSDHESLDGKQ